MRQRRLRFVREAIERNIAHHAAFLATAEQIESLYALIALQKEAEKGEDYRRFVLS